MVIAWDAAGDLRSMLADGTGPVREPGLDEALRSAIEGGRLVVTESGAEAMSRAPITHLAYDTIVDSSGRPDDPRLESGVATFAQAAPDGALLLVSSQVPVGTSGTWRRLLDNERRDLRIAYVPENLRLGQALGDFLSPARLLIGVDDDESWDLATNAVMPFHTEPMRMGIAAAEMAKHATNAYLALC